MTDILAPLTGVPVEDVYAFLSPFSSRGEGQVRDGSVGKVVATLTAAALRVEVLDAELGKYVIKFENPVLTDTTEWEYDEDDNRIERDDPTGLSDAELRIIERGTWEVYDNFERYFGLARSYRAHRHEQQTPEERAAAVGQVLADLSVDAGGSLSASRRYAFGRDFCTFSFTRLHIEPVDVGATEGACRGCGSTRFTMAARAVFPVEVAGDGLALDLEVSSPDEFLDTVKIANVLVDITCKGCGLDHPSERYGRYDGMLAGTRWESDGSGKGVVSLRELFEKTN